MSTKTLFLAWQDKRETSREWFPIGRLDADVDARNYSFRYIKGAEQAKQQAGFPFLIEFPDIGKKYQSPVLFPIFRNRVMSSRRPDFKNYLRSLDLEMADPMQILSVSGGRRVTDAYEVFPKIEKREDGSFTCRFFLHGWRYVNSQAQERIKNLVSGENLYVTHELTNPATGLAVQIQTEDYHMIGWTPRYLVEDLVAAKANSPKPNYSARVVQVNPMPVPSNLRVLIEMQGCWDKGYDPMSGPDFQPLVD